MKRCIILFCLLMACFGAYAQKSYITVVSSDLHEKRQLTHLTGDLPSDIKNYYNDTTCGHILNLLAQQGYEVEQMSGLGTNNTNVIFLLSKKSSNHSSTRIVEIDEDEDVSEVARYNLQGMPISKNEKGVQVIVYSNYTTKTVIVQ